MATKTLLDKPEKTFQQMAKLSDKQWQICQLATSVQNGEILGGGAGGGGKSYAARACAVYCCMILAGMGVKNPRWILARNSYGDVKDNHAGKFMEEWGDWGEIKSSDKIHGFCFKFFDPKLGVILLRNMEEGKDRKGSRAHGACIDELTETSELAYGQLKYQLSEPAPFNTIVTFSNPDGRHYRWVMKAWRCKNPEPGWFVEGDTRRIYVPFLGPDNPQWETMKAGFMASISHLPEAVRQGRLKGIWGAPEGARWPGLSEHLHQFSFEDLPGGIPPEWQKGLGVDYGRSNPYAGIFLAADPEGRRIYVYRERYAARVPTDRQAGSLKAALEVGEKLSWAHGDPAMWQKETTAQDLMPVTAAEIYQGEFAGDDRLECGFSPGVRIQCRTHVMALIDELVRIREDGEPILKIEKNCTNLWDELTTAIHAKADGTGRIGDIDDKNADHAITGLFYGIPAWLMKKIMEKPKEPENPWQKAQEDRMKRTANLLTRGRRR